MRKMLMTLAAGAMLATVGCGQSQTTTTTGTPAAPATPATMASPGAPGRPGDVTVVAPSATVNVSQPGDVNVVAPSATVNVTTGGGGQDTQALMGVPPYPGASQQMSMQGGSGGEQGSVAILTTTDPYDKVVSFYKEKFPTAQVTAMDAAGMKNTAIVVEATPGNTMAINITAQGPNVMIQIARATHGGGAPDGDAPPADDTIEPGSSPAPDGGQ